MSKLLQELEKRILIFDGAMGSSIQNYDLSVEKDFLGHENCSEILLKTRPDVISEIHSNYLKAGTDIIETNTFGANKIVLKEYGLEDKIVELNYLGAKIARQCVDKFSTDEQPRFIAGSIGPGTKLPSLDQISFKELYDSYILCAKGLIDGGVDCFIIETCQDLLQIKAAVIAVKDKMQEMGVKLPIFVQVTVEETGTMLVGSDLEAVCTALKPLGIDSLGINCAAGPKEMGKHIEIICENWDGYISMQPNAGIPVLKDGEIVYDVGPDGFAKQVFEIVSKNRINMAGGCCGTTFAHMEVLVRKFGDCHVAKNAPRNDKKTMPDDFNGFTFDVRRPTSDVFNSFAPDARRPTPNVFAFASLYSSIPVKQDGSIFFIGERLNATGSKAYRDMLNNEDFDAMSALAKDQIAKGAKMLDVSVSMVGRDEKQDMVCVVKRLVKDSVVPLMIDSRDPEVIEAALECIPGNAVVNSINLEDGGENLDKICKLCKRFGAGVVALTIDEQGMAKTKERKLEIVERLLCLAHNKHKIALESIFIDPLTFTICTGTPDDRGHSQETLLAVEMLRKNHPECQIILGLSNVSFGIKADARKILNSVFLHEGIKKGVTSGIVHAGNLLSIHNIDKEILKAANDLIYNKKEHALQDYLNLFIDKECFALDVGRWAKKTEKKHLSIEDEIKNMIVNGDKSKVEENLKKALDKYEPIEIINKFLLEGMQEVGDLFEKGEMQLPFMLQSAEVMKACMDFLENYITGGKEKRKPLGTIVLATVYGDVHDIGKDLMDIILSSNGFKVYNIGVKKRDIEILKAVEEYKPDVIGLSGLLVGSTMEMKKNLAFFKENGINIPVLVGGAALTEEFVKNDLKPEYEGEVYYCKDAFSGLRAMQEIV